jgi:hypothetical protein
MKQYTFLLETIVNRINPRNINYDDIDLDNNTSKNPNYQQSYLNNMGTGKPYKEKIFVSDKVLENFALLVTCCKYGDSVYRKCDNDVGMYDTWYKCFSRAYYRYENIAKNVANRYNSINDLNVIKQLIGKTPYNLFIHASVCLIKDYLNFKSKKLFMEDEYYMDVFKSLEEYYMCYVKTYNELKNKFK